ncbi:DUF192 domain-containing protein [Candidatus Uhrbacteria bacterium]|nr:DUF192 domain-containing protein [Candidatus Uhrbacteria bacterium]
MKRMHTWIGFIALCVGGIVFFTVGAQFIAPWFHGPSNQGVMNHAPTKTISINNKPLTLEIVSDPADVKQGLSDRPSMPLGHGMLFLFAVPDRYTFWMPRMHFPLDILWIQDGVVVDMTTLPTPKSLGIPASYKPKTAADHVLELKAGQAEAYGLSIGSNILFE